MTQIRLSPSFAITKKDYAAKFPHPDQIKISQKSALYLDGTNVVVKSLDLDGALVVQACDGANVTIEGRISNKGWEWQELEDGKEYPEEVTIRGYTKVEHETARFIIEEPGEYSIQDGKMTKL